MTTIGITGVAGFVGTNLTSHFLRQGHRVVGIDLQDRHGRLSAAGLLKHPRFTFELADLTRTESISKAIQDIDVLFHLAALPHVDYSYFHPHRVISNNVESLMAAAEMAIDLRIPLIFSSSVEVYGGAEDKIYTEDSPLTPLSPYAASKVAGEAIIKTYIETQGLSATIFRFTNLYGPWQAPDRLLPRVISQILSGFDVVVEKGTNRDFIFIEQACELLATAIDLPHCGETYNLSSGARRDNYEVVQKVLELLPASNVQIIKPRRHDGRGKYLVASPNKLSRKTGWRAPADISSGITKTVDWYKSHSSWLSQFQSNLRSDRQTNRFLTDSSLHLLYWS